MRELCERMGFDFLVVSDPAGIPLAAVIRTGGQVTPIDAAPRRTAPKGLLTLGGKVYQIASVPIDQADENLGRLSVGDRFDFSEFTTPAVLLRDGQSVKSNLPGISRVRRGERWRVAAVRRMRRTVGRERTIFRCRFRVFPSAMATCCAACRMSIRRRHPCNRF